MKYGLEAQAKWPFSGVPKRVIAQRKVPHGTRFWATMIVAAGLPLVHLIDAIRKAISAASKFGD
jgi:hypothetical protein